jgi:hypothetical protein
MDFYSKIVLSIIAIALSALVLQNAGILSTMRQAGPVSPAMAAPLVDGLKVQLCSRKRGSFEWNCANINEQGKLEVDLKGY